MTGHPPADRPHGQHAFAAWNVHAPDGLRLVHRRATLKAGLAGIAGLSLPTLLRCRQQALAAGTPLNRRKSVILVWMTGGPSHIDTWDVKPRAPAEIRGPFATIGTALPGVRLTEYYPLQAARLERFTLIRSVDARHSNHEPNQVFQTANSAAEPRTNPEAEHYPALASLIAQHRGPNHPALPPYVVLNMQSRSHVAWGGALGRRFDPFLGQQAASLFQLPTTLSHERLADRQHLRQSLDRLRHDLDQEGSLAAVDVFTRQALEMVVGPEARAAFDLARESPAVRQAYGDHPWCQQALLARRLVEAGVNFVTIDLSRHSASGTWDTHGDNIPPYGGIWNGLRPLLPVFDHLITTLVDDLHQRGLLDDVLVLAMGEFGRTPRIGTQGSTDGRDHWPYVMSLLMAGGGFRHGQVIGESERDGGSIRHRPVTPGDLAATIFHHMQVPLDLSYTDFRGRPRRVIEDGSPLAELI